MLRISLLSLAVLLAGCSLIPEYQRPASPSAAQYPQGTVYPAPTQAAPRTEDWRSLFNDPALQQLIESALVNNRDLRVAALNVEAFQAQYRIQRADLLPAVSATASESRQRMPPSVTRGKALINSTYAVNLGVSAYELDFSAGCAASVSRRCKPGWRPSRRGAVPS